MDAAKTPPASDELEVSLFGPGVGESVLVHLGCGEWLVADSCCAPGTKVPAALEYLEQIGVSPAAAVKLVVVTHWHDDHIKGISRVVEAAPSARVCCSAALQGEEFLRFVAHYRRNAMLGASSGVDEMHRVLTLLKDARAPTARPASTGPEWVKSNECLWRRQAPAAAVHALSPSSGALTLALQEFGEALATLKPRKRAVAQTKNEIAVAMWVEVAGVKILLGSDLEESADSNCGWQAIVRAAARPPGKAHVVKVAHHGSETAHSDDVWTHMLEPKPHAILTTYTSGTRPLPSPADVVRIGREAGTLHATAPPRGWSPTRRDPAVERTLKEAVANRRRLVGKMGQVRLRCKLGSNPTFSIELLGSALSLASGSATAV